MKIEGTTYELIATSTTKGIFSLVDDIEEKAELSILATEGLNQIAEDFIREKLEFDTWAAAIKEIEIRGVGYAVETTMRSMFETNKVKDGIYKDALADVSALRRELDDLIQSSSSSDKPYIEEMRRQVKAQEDAANALDDGILRWTGTSYLKYEFRKNQLVQWLLGERTEEPKLMNCWECVLFALVKTAPHNVTKEYFHWAINLAPDSIILPRFYSSCKANMDYYFPRHGTPVLDATKERLRPSNDRLKRFNLPPPEELVIPRGRMLIFDDVSHVALSTGKPFPIESSYAREVFGGRKKGHGLLDLNVKEHTIRERTVEEMVGPTINPPHGANNHHLIVAPFPICTETRTIESSGSVRLTDEEKLEYLKSIDELAGKIYDKAVERYAAARQSALKAGKADPIGIENRYRTGIRSAKEKLERAALNAKKELDASIQSLDDIMPESKTESIVFRYGPADPYSGKVTF